MQKHSINDYSVTISIYLNLSGYNSCCPKNFPLIMTDVWSHTISTESLIYFLKPSVCTRVWKQKLPTMCPESLTPNFAIKRIKQCMHSYIALYLLGPSGELPTGSWRRNHQHEHHVSAGRRLHTSPGLDPSLRMNGSKGTAAPGKVHKVGTEQQLELHYSSP